MQSDKCNGTQKIDLKKYMYRIINDFIEDAVWELSFEVHRAAKLGYLCLESEEENSESLKHDGQSAVINPTNSGRKSQVAKISKTVQCAVCSKFKDSVVYAKHLTSCMQIKNNFSRSASKKAIDKIAEQNSSTILDDDFDAEAEREEQQRALEAKRRRAAKARVVKINDMQEMTLDKRQKFFNKFCGAETKHGSKLCTKPRKCSQHTDEEKNKIRSTFIDDSNQCENEQIDVDTVPEENLEAPLSQQPWLYNSIPENITREVFPYPAGMWSI